MKLPELEDLVRTQVSIVAQPGPLAGAVVARIVAAAKEYAHDSLQADLPLLASGPSGAAPDALRGPVDLGKVLEGLTEARASLRELYVLVKKSAVSLG